MLTQSTGRKGRADYNKHGQAFFINQTRKDNFPTLRSRDYALASNKRFPRGQGGGYGHGSYESSDLGPLIKILQQTTRDTPLQFKNTEAYPIGNVTEVDRVFDRNSSDLLLTPCFERPQGNNEYRGRFRCPIGLTVGAAATLFTVGLIYAGCRYRNKSSSDTVTSPNSEHHRKSEL